MDASTKFFIYARKSTDDPKRQIRSIEDQFAELRDLAKRERLNVVRISYLLNNRCFVISESAEANPYGDGVVFSDYAKMVECCLFYLRPEAEAARNRITESGHANLKTIPFLSSLQSALAFLENPTS